jgi:hypothetical protein
MKPSTCCEQKLQRLEAAHLGPFGLLLLAFLFLCLCPMLAVSWIKSWFLFRRECAWCTPRHYLGGNPFARTVTSTMCSRARTRVYRETLAYVNSQRSLSPSVPSVATAARRSCKKSLS